MRVTVQHSGTEIPTCKGNKFAQLGTPEEALYRAEAMRITIVVLYE
jgi:hypothetical protein